MEDKQMNEKYFLYVIICDFYKYSFMKIGKTKNLENRIKNIQTGCPHKIRDVFIVSSDYEEEINGLEHYLHYFLKNFSINNEWYLISEQFICALFNELYRINTNDFSFDEIDSISDEINFDSLEILFHNHNYMFLEVKKVKGKYSKKETLSIDELFSRIIQK